MPPVLDPLNSKVDGLAFLGLSLARNAENVGHPDSATHQEAFDLNQVLDRDYDFIFSTNDDGWLVGGGEPGPPTSYKLAAKDSAHVEIMRIGTYRKDWGGVEQEEIIKVLTSGEILIPQIEVLPTAVVANPDRPPELEIRFDMVPEIPDFDDEEAPLPVNWQLRFLHNQLFKKFIFPSRFCPGAFHSTILRKAEFRSEDHREQYFAKCDAAIAKWKEQGPQPLNTIARDLTGNPITKMVSCEKEEVDRDASGQETPNVVEGNPSMTEIASEKEEEDEAETGKEFPNVDFHSGLWLFTDRENITHFFAPNFLPPYNTPSARKIIMDVLKDEWDETSLSWKPCGEGSMTKKKLTPPACVEEPKIDDLGEEKKDDEDSVVVEEEQSMKVFIERSNQGEFGKASDFAEKFDEMVGDILNHANICAQVTGISALRIDGKNQPKDQQLP